MTFTSHRLSIKDNLFKRTMIPTSTQSCVGGCGHMEDTVHLFLHCDWFRHIWIDVYDWLGVDMVIPYRISNQLSHISVLGGFWKYKLILFHLIWCSTLWILWKERNVRIFKNKDDNIHYLLDKIKAYSYKGEG